MKKGFKFHYINSRLFCFSLLILLVNDFYLKAAYHNFLTGKLSDLFGLITFVLFFSDVFKNQRKIVYILTAILFAYWKSPFSSSFIYYFSEYVYGIDRVVDPSDCLTLLFLPLIYKYHPSSFLKRKFAINILFFTAIFAFSATSKSRPKVVFDPPQYLCFTYDTSILDTSHYISENGVYIKEKHIIIEIDEFSLKNEPTRQDDYFESQLIRELPQYSIQQLIKNPIDSLGKDLILKSITPDGSTRYEIQNKEYSDLINFKGVFMNGSFKRYGNDGKLVISGNYTQGVKTLVWEYYEIGKLVKKCYYNNNGELIKEEIITDKGYLTKDKITRNELIYIIAVVVFILITILIFAIYKFVKTYISYDKNGPVSIGNNIMQFLLSFLIILFTIFILGYISGPFDFPLLFGYDLVPILFIYIISNFVLIIGRFFDRNNQLFILNIMVFLIYINFKFIIYIYLLTT